MIGLIWSNKIWPNHIISDIDLSQETFGITQYISKEMEQIL